MLTVCYTGAWSIQVRLINTVFTISGSVTALANNYLVHKYKGLDNVCNTARYNNVTSEATYMGPPVEPIIRKVL